MTNALTGSAVMTHVTASQREHGASGEGRNGLSVETLATAE